MHLLQRAGAGLSTVLLLAGCRAGEPKQDASSADASVPVWTLSTKSEEARTRIEAGERADDRGRPLTAYEQFKRAVAADSAFAYGYLRVAQTGLSLDEYRTNLQRANAYKGSANEIERLLIDIEQRGFDRDQQGALDLANQLVAKQPNNPRAWWVLSFAQFNSGQVAESRASLKKAVDLAPSYGATHIFYGNSFLAEPKDLATAEQHIREGGRLWPQEPLSYDFLGDVQRAQGKLADAVVSYSRMIELDPEPADQYSQRGHANVFLGRYDQARADYDAAIRHSKANQPAVYAGFRATVSTYAGDPAASIQELGQLVQAIDGMGIPEPDGQKINVLSTQALIATHARQFDVARRALSQRRSLIMKRVERVGTPEFRRGQEANIAFLDGVLAAFEGNYATAQQKAADYMRLVAPDRNPAKNRPAHAILGFVALFQKRYNDAIAEFNQADPDNVYLRYHRALALEGAGRTAEAKALFRDVANYNFNVPGYGLVRKDAIAKAN